MSGLGFAVGTRVDYKDFNYTRISLVLFCFIQDLIQYH